MRRRHPPQERGRPRLEIVPMIDIMMFLLVFFVMIVLKMIPDSGVKLQLPGASTANELKPTQIVIMIDPNGGLHIKNQSITRAGLTRSAYIAVSSEAPPSLASASTTAR